MTRIADLVAEPLDIELSEPFGIATGAQAVARNVLVRVVTDSGVVGLGEAAPFPAVSGETQQAALQALERLRGVVIGMDAARWRRIAAALAEAEPGLPSARAALEMAVLDAFGRARGFDLWRFFGGVEPELVTDITVVTGSAAAAAAAARRADQAGFRLLKVKVGGAPLEHDVERLTAVARAAPGARLLLDANASLDAKQAIDLIRALGELARRIVLFEQPVPAADHAGLRQVKEESGIPVAADESARSAADVTALKGVVDVVNVKLTKSGVAETLDMVCAARAAGLRLMVGGMVESKLAMTVAACLAAGIGGFSFVDLDTPMFLVDAPFEGGFAADGPKLRVDCLGPGHGVGLRAVLG